MFLDKIVAATRARIARLRVETSLAALESRARAHSPSSLAAALKASSPAIIAEVKKASPSRGLFRSDFDPLALAASYHEGGAAALSVVTEPEYFQGSDQWLTQIRVRTALPILRKDFILDPLQVAESAALGADAILLIARLLSAEQMRELQAAAGQLRLEILFEAHDEADLEKIDACAPALIGINARNLDTFVVDTDQFARLRAKLSADAIAIAESGLSTHADIAAARRLGYAGFLIGETLVRAADPAALLRLLRDGASA
ncbi:MAG TPA: indole-3-glycerol phosphate synthase TrpC [bacterium]|nr:indole-3-glycerol phosphate synthase TrpC [bacterium]